MSVRLVALGWIAGLSCCLAEVPSVTNVQAEQRRGTPYVEIAYDLSGGSTDKVLTVTVAVSTNGGAAFFSPVAGLSGDTGRGVAQGVNKKIVWNAGAVLSPNFYKNVQVKVTAGDAPAGMVLIPAGTNSGNNPDFGAYSLTVDAFYMDSTEVTKALWDTVYAWAVVNGYDFDNNLEGEGPHGKGKASNHPVQTVNWYDCAKWCNARSEMDGRKPCYTVGGSVYKTGSYGWDDFETVGCNFFANGYRLPTNMEWEYAARGGLSSRRFPWGDTIDHSRANYYGFPANFDGYFFDTGYYGYDTRYATGDFPYTSPVGSFAANGYRLYDMAGNVLEWCNDDIALYSYRGPRGGCWNGGASDACCGGYLRDPTVITANYSIGFRCLCR